MFRPRRINAGREKGEERIKKKKERKKKSASERARFSAERRDDESARQGAAVAHYRSSPIRARFGSLPRLLPLSRIRSHL